jgi:hypothetical protein
MGARSLVVMTVGLVVLVRRAAGDERADTALDACGLPRGYWPTSHCFNDRNERVYRCVYVCVHVHVHLFVVCVRESVSASVPVCSCVVSLCACVCVSARSTHKQKRNT